MGAVSSMDGHEGAFSPSRQGGFPAVAASSGANPRESSTATVTYAESSGGSRRAEVQVETADPLRRIDERIAVPLEACDHVVAPHLVGTYGVLGVPGEDVVEEPCMRPRHCCRSSDRGARQPASSGRTYPELRFTLHPAAEI